MVINNVSDKYSFYLFNNSHVFSHPNIYVFIILQSGILAYVFLIIMCKAYHFMGNSYQQNMLMHDDLHHNEYYHQDYDV